MPRRAAAAGGASRAPHSIGQVLALLAPEFPELTPSKLRFLEEQGLVAPERTPSGYRKFSAADVERLRTVLALQRDHYLPLKVIRSQLAERDAGATPLPVGPAAPSILSTGRRLSREELLAAAHADAGLYDEAVANGLVRGGDVHGDEALTVLSALGRLAERGIRPRHLRGYRTAAEREAGLVETALTTVRRRLDTAAAARADDAEAELVTQLETVRRALVAQALGEPRR